MTTAVNNALEAARAACRDAGRVAADVASGHSEPPPVPKGAEGFGEAIERVKLGQAAIWDARSALLETAAALKAAHADEARAGKASLNDAQKRELELRLEDDLAYAEAVARAERMSRMWAVWDARRSRLNRDFEVARIELESRRRRQDADYLANRLRSAR